MILVLFEKPDIAYFTSEVAEFDHDQDCKMSEGRKGVAVTCKISTLLGG